MPEVPKSERNAQLAGTIHKQLPALARAENFGDLGVGTHGEEAFVSPNLLALIMVNENFLKSGVGAQE